MKRLTGRDDMTTVTANINEAIGALDLALAEVKSKHGEDSPLAGSIHFVLQEARSLANFANLAND